MLPGCWPQGCGRLGRSRKLLPLAPKTCWIDEMQCDGDLQELRLSCSAKCGNKEMQNHQGWAQLGSPLHIAAFIPTWCAPGDHHMPPRCEWPSATPTWAWEVRWSLAALLEGPAG